MNEKLYDVVAVNMKTSEVRLIATGKDHGNADAIVKMAIARRGLDEEFYSEVIHGHYEEGDKWKGKGDIKPYEPETSDDGRIQRIGNTWYPVGPRGL
jgi:hypothetical protein